MTGDEVWEVFEAIVPPEEVACLGQQFGVVEHDRKLNLGVFMQAVVISAGTLGGAL